MSGFLDLTSRNPSLWIGVWTQFAYVHHCQWLLVPPGTNGAPGLRAPDSGSGVTTPLQPVARSPEPVLQNSNRAPTRICRGVWNCGPATTSETGFPKSGFATPLSSSTQLS